jgi:isoprenylcysteine carboxyl methyltransferase (ICMT) family protein YpbQ
MRRAICIILALVLVQRLAEVVYAERNTRALRARGAVEVGCAHYPLIVLLHSAWLTAGEVHVAIVFTILNAAMLAKRIREEDAALEPRRVGARQNG